ncbi:hypothetical protein [Rhodococcus zopfii]|uniref:hypothetical protein n=1 Tax=Rhodococcus zopfii TaxID=43772 RepID=UPI001EDD9367|nr:hypothetical protein [Rhodococcus zopfii]
MSQLRPYDIARSGQAGEGLWLIARRASEVKEGNRPESADLKGRSPARSEGFALILLDFELNPKAILPLSNPPLEVTSCGRTTWITGPGIRGLRADGTVIELDFTETN